jgi:hypothetical protein
MFTGDWLCSHLWRLCSVDTRALALTRIGVALVVLGDVASRARDLTAHYTDAGVLPRSLRASGWITAGGLNLHGLSGASGVVASLFVVHAMAAIALALGWHTRIASWTCWALWLSLFERNPYVTDGGDRVLGLVLLWGALSPWGSHGSLDARRRGDIAPRTVCTAATLALMLQMPLVYVITGHAKSGDDWTQSFTAVHHALRSAHTLPGRALLALPPWVSAALTALTLVMERYLPFVLLSPFKTRALRRVVFIAFAAMQVGIFIAVYRSHFAFISVVAMLPWFPIGNDTAPRQVEPRSRWHPVTTALSLSLLVASFDVIGVLHRGVAVAPALQSLRALLHLNQHWEMYAPNPRHQSGFALVFVHTADGRELDALTASAATWEPPSSPWHPFARQRWIGYLLALRESHNVPRRRAFVRAFCRQWNRMHFGNDRAIRAVARYVRWRHLDGLRSAPREHFVWADEACEP